MKKRILIITLSILIVAIATVGTTLAYFSAKTDTVENVFTMGNVSATISEEEAWENSQKVMPGDTKAKSPVITIGATSESAWVFIKVEVSDAAALQAAVHAENTETTDLLVGIATDLASGWALMGTPSVSVDVKTYIYGYDTVVSANKSTSPIFTAITLPDTVNGEDQKPAPDGALLYGTLIVDGFTIEATGYAIQSANVEDLAAAYNIGVTSFEFPELPVHP